MTRRPVKGRWVASWVATVVVAVALGQVSPAGSAPPDDTPPAQRVLVTNGDTAPVPVAGTLEVTNLDQAAPPPLWQGTPYVESVPIGGARFCEPFPDLPDGMVLFAERVVGNVRFQPDASTVIAIQLVPLGADTHEQLNLPVFPAGKISGDLSFSGVLDLGIPLTTLRGCGSAIEVVGGFVTVIGYLVPLP